MISRIPGGWIGHRTTSCLLEDPLLVDPAVRTDLLGDDSVIVRDFVEGPVEEFFLQVTQWQQDGSSVEEAASVLGSMPTPHGVPFSEAWCPDMIRAWPLAIGYDSPT